MGKNYGLPYMGSKNKIAEWVVAHIPQADTLVDLFAVGINDYDYENEKS